MISITSINYLLNSKFNLYLKETKILSSNGEYITCLVNNEYIFNIILNPANQKYENEKNNLDYLRQSLNTSLLFPDIKYSFISDDIVIKGYKKIDGISLNTNIIKLMTKEKQDKLAKDISTFLTSLHSLSHSKESKTKETMLDEIEIIKIELFPFLTQTEINYINNFIDKLSSTDESLFSEYLSHNSISYSRFIINKENDLIGVVEFDELGYSPIYKDFLPLLIEDDFTKKILDYSHIDINKLLTYKELIDSYYPIKLIAQGLKTNRNDIVENGRRIINAKVKKID